MDKLEQAVRKALASLLLPPLQDIVLKYLPDRGVLQLNILGDCVCANSSFKVVRCSFVNIEPLVVAYDWSNFDANGEILMQFSRAILDFPEFTLHFGSCQLKGGINRVTIVYQGEPEIVQIE
jgi:hypothetical protein